MKQSAGLLLYRRAGDEVRFFLVHPGGPFFIKKDAGWWTVPKGEIDKNETPLAAAIREFEEETGFKPTGPFYPLTPIIQKGGKHISCWFAEGDLDPLTVKSNEFEIEWPPRSGKKKSFPEIDKAGWFNPGEAKRLINERQAGFIEEALALLIR